MIIIDDIVINSTIIIPGVSSHQGIGLSQLRIPLYHDDDGVSHAIFRK